MKFRHVLGFAAALALASAQALAQGSTTQFPTSPWVGFAPSNIQCGWLKGANFNTTADQAIPISVPSVGWIPEAIAISAPSASLTTAAGGFYTGASKSGITLVANTQAYSTLTTNTANTTGNAMLATLAAAATTTELSSTSVIYLSLTTAQGTAATANIRVYCRPFYSVN